jgi:hypothetical protein
MNMHTVLNPMLFSTSRVKSLLQDFKTLEVWEEEVMLNEGRFHQGSASVIRAIGVK